MKSLTTGNATSASSSATRISRSAPLLQPVEYLAETICQPVEHVRKALRSVVKQNSSPSRKSSNRTMPKSGQRKKRQ
jgi:hypothetical protein